MRCTELFAEYESMKAENLQLREELRENRQCLLQAPLRIAQLRMVLFGPWTDKLTSDQERQLQAPNRDIEHEAQDSIPFSDEVLEREDRAARRHISCSLAKVAAE